LCLIVLPLPPGKNPFAVKIIQFNSILYYLRAESTATRQLSDSAQCRYRKFLEENTLMENVNKQTSKHTKMRGNKNYITQNIIIIIIK
jgi:hypothetical protein